MLARMYHVFIIKNTIEEILEMSDIKFNYVLINFYRDGNDCIGWHSDREAIVEGMH